MNKYEVLLNWDLGYEESFERLTLDELAELLKNGRKDGDSEVTSIMIFTPVTPEYQERTGALPVKDGKLNG